MKTTEILESLANVDKKYIEASAEDNVGNVFDRKKAGKIIGRIISVAAVAALAVFASVLVISRSNDNIAASMVDRSADVPHSFTKEDISKISYTSSGEKTGVTSVTVPVCEIENHGGTTTDGYDYIVDAGSRLLKIENTYTLEYNEKDNTRYIVKTEDGNEIYKYEWTHSFFDAGRSEWKELNGGLLIATYKMHGLVVEDTEASFELIMLNGDGTERWRARHLNPLGTHPELVLQAYCEDGKVYIVGAIAEDEYRKIQNEDYSYDSYSGNELCRGFTVTVYDETTGKLIDRRTSEAAFETQMNGIHCIGMTEYGFVITVMHENGQDEAYIVLVGYDGEIKSVTRYNAYYEFYSASGINGQIYLCGEHMAPHKNMVPILGREAFSTNAYAFSHIYYKNTDYYKPNASLTKKFKEETSAALMVCDGTLTPVKVYRQSGSYGGMVRSDGDKLLWDVCAITDVYSGGYNSDTSVTLNSSTKTVEINSKGTLVSAVSSDTAYVMYGVKYDCIWDE